jgi:tellurite resistance protein
MVVGTGFEPVERLLQACVAAAASVSAEAADTQLRTQELADLRDVIEAWPKLSAELRAAARAVTRAAAG